ncbi:MAG: YebC/PmpR family DNA-binding transcriptional regulator, partial [Chloroflexi bacterium]|nr:YebC/PmpR family DNA-binding transcriptional regulator [Chloroflexota bacterium]
RSSFNGRGGKLAEPGAVSWMFEPKGVVIVSGGSASEDDVFLVAADAGAEDIRVSDESIEVVTPPDALKPVRDALTGAGIAVESFDLTQVPKTTISLEGSDAKRLLGLIEALEDHDDVQEVFANFDISDEVLTSIA